MTSVPHNQNNIKPVYKPAVIGFGLVILAILGAISGALGDRIGWWDFGAAVTIFKWSAYAGIFAAVLCLTGLVAARPGGKRRGFILSLLGLLFVAPMILYLQSWQEAKQTLPPIQDISTDMENPPSFWSAPNYRVYGEFNAAHWQQEAYPDIQPLILPISVDTAFDLVLKLISKKGWKLWESDRDEMHIEATETTFWFGYNDDVVIHITELDENTSRLDMRSTSRAGSGGDGGTNANRIRSLFNDLNKRSGGLS